MTPIPLSQVRTILQAAPVQLPARSVERVSTDTRTVAEGDLFFALRGDNFDAHDLLSKATPAAAAVVERVPDNAPPGLPLLVVPNTRKALGQLARHYRRSLKHTKVIAVAGSNGKTGTKHLIHAALCKHLRGSISPRSFNNDIGVPLTLLPVKPADDYVIVECGTNHRGEIEALSQIAQPDIAVITGVGEEHLEGLGDLDGVRKENAAITSGMSAAGTLIINGDDPGLVAACGRFGGRRVTFGLNRENDLFAADVACDADGVSFKLNGSRIVVKLPLLGRHNASNALAAIGVAKRLAIPDAKWVAGLAEATGPSMRLERVSAGDVKLINDAYNANPQSMQAALRTLAELPHDGRKLAVLGDMLELGEASDQYHRDAGRQAAEANLNGLCCVGSSATLIADAATAAGMPADRITTFDTTQTAADTIPGTLHPGDLVLLKASRGLRFEVIADAIVAAHG